MMNPVLGLSTENAFNFSIDICCSLFLRQSVYILLFLFCPIYVAVICFSLNLFTLCSFFNPIYRNPTLEDAVWISVWMN